MVQDLRSAGHMHFTGTTDDVINFGRPITQLYLNTTGSATISFDGGDGYMDLSEGTHTFPYPHVKSIVMTGANWNGVGISV